ncbi:MAG: tetraacyldisaccharide 4'-kinase [Helicobacter sp.]|uniref:tetraacyldisaccharide 4'-kinase n=1 Tax=Helicobacter sp. TaxID=218 RepID=UPI002A908B33|nr:tetraacyldisaccharide 4'-kinase [Helicobacter sp.]MDY5822983.1 tetraacyldisaccharide 4'-kinase [Helicobacter sp.]
MQMDIKHDGESMKSSEERDSKDSIKSKNMKSSKEGKQIETKSAPTNIKKDSIDSNITIKSSLKIEFNEARLEKDSKDSVKSNMNTESLVNTNTECNTKQSKTTESSTNKMGFIESYFFYPSFWHKILAFALLPFSCIYALITLYKKCFAKKRNFSIKILSIGNLVSGGSGKTPFCIALTNYLQIKGYTDIYVVLRGYKRNSKGLIQVSSNGEILVNVAQSGDEAMLIAMQTKASVIVSESRIKALEYIQTKDSKHSIVILDDAYRFNFNKFDILLEPKLKPYFPFVLPSGYYRFPESFYTKCDLHLKEDRDYKRSVSISHVKDSIQDSSTETTYILATAIANPSRLKPYLPENIVYEYYLADHAEFDYNTLKALLEKYHATHILMTQKDYVKCLDFNLPFALLMLDIKIESSALKSIESFLNTESFFAKQG